MCKFHIITKSFKIYYNGSSVRANFIVIMTLTNCVYTAFYKNYILLQISFVFKIIHCCNGIIFYSVRFANVLLHHNIVCTCQEEFWRKKMRRPQSILPSVRLKVPHQRTSNFFPSVLWIQIIANNVMLLLERRPLKRFHSHKCVDLQLST